MLNEYVNNTYIHSSLHMTYAEILEPVLYYIIGHNSCNELLNILDDEIRSSVGKCFQGRIARTINIINGYHPSIEIYVSQNEQINNIILNIKQ